MNLRVTGAVATFVVVLSAPLLAQDRGGCVNATDNVRAINACSEFIRSHPKDAVAYHVRGEALAKNGDLGQAITDYTKAIQLDPNYAPAYNSRGAAFANKGDYTSALADVMKAGEIKPAAVVKPVKTQAPARPKAKSTHQASARVQEKKAPPEPTWVDGRPNWQ